MKVEKTKEAADFEVRTPYYMTDYQFRAANLVFFNRNHNFSQKTSDIDVFGPFWSIALVDVDRGRLAVHRLGAEVSLHGPTTIFIPPYSIIDWRLPMGSISWSAYMGNSPCPANLPQKPTAYRGLAATSFSSAEEIFDYLRRLEPYALLDKIEIENTTALRLKEKIDQNYSTAKSIEALAHELHMPHASMTRAFRKTFGVTPIAYRNRMRIFEAMRLMLMEGEKAITACFRVGFSDVSRFNKWFRRQMSAVPSQFCYKKNAKKNKLSTNKQELVP